MGAGRQRAADEGAERSADGVFRRRESFGGFLASFSYAAVKTVVAQRVLGGLRHYMSRVYHR